ncbi:3-methylitaconate isomerase [Clostridium sp. MCC353]|uniref:2-methylaconitate cis-trans isomerase PrpF family protein n=1 Tax=Clostridium sp. MCC353 TaxID=2592646 RepID=UPI001C0248D7|nr:PrpF domain-containing protein [Clostridium sp. MCC353]MBT9776914.1 3-methylitaconate isomerase [Clostridium sp. MCC353]
MVSKHMIPCTIMRGGTSKGLFFMEKDLPPAGEMRDRILMELMGSPDKKQIDGLGGAASVTSKVAIISISDREDADVDYTFAQVSVDKALVSYKGNCGNISSAVGPYAIEKGLVKITGDVTKVRIYNTNTDKVIVSEVQTKGGAVNYRGDLAIAGVPGTAAPIKLNFVNPAGSVTGKLLPTGHASDRIEVPGVGEVEISIVDAANPLVFVKAEDLGLDGTELPAELDQNEEMLDRLETVRGIAAVKLGLIDDYKKSAWETPGVPKMTFVSKPAAYKTAGDTEIAEDQVDIVSRMMSMQKTHPTYAMTGAMCTVAAAVIPGSVVNQVLREDADTSYIRIGHPGGILPAGVDFKTEENGEVTVLQTAGFRTANFLMDGMAYYNGK